MAYKQPDLEGEIRSFIREGAKDLHNAIVPAFPESQRGVDEPGTPLAPTQAQITQELGGYEAMRSSYAQGAAQEQEQELQQE